MSKVDKHVDIEGRRERKNELIKTLKSMIAPLIFFAIIAAFIVFVVTFESKETEEEVIVPRAYEKVTSSYVMENDDIKFTMDSDTTQFEVYVKDGGKTWYSNPSDAANDSLALTSEKGNLQSTVIMTYSNTTGLEVTYDSYTYSVTNGIYEIEQAEDESITVHYSLGKVDKTYVIPPVCTEDEFNALADQMSEADKNFFQQAYKKYDINNLSKKDSKEELLERYPIMESTVIYALRDTTKDGVKSTIEKALEGCGYTYEKYLEDCELDTSQGENDNPIFNLDMIYRLEGDSLVVEIPYANLESYDEYKIYEITMLPYFGAGGLNDEGYLFVPEGGGATINFNNGRTSQSSYYANLYGWDMCIKRDSLVHNTRAYFNVFGIANGDASFICMLEEGGSYASIFADISGKNNSYNYVNAEYSIKQREKYDVGTIAVSDVYEYIDELPQDESLIQRYVFVDSNDYVDMAKRYGEYLTDEYGDAFSAMNDDSEAPVTVEILCAVDKVKQILGIPVSRPLKTTSYEEAGELITELNSEGFDNMSVKLTGWCNGGVSQKILKKVKLIKDLGTKKDLQNLSDTASSLGVDLYLNGITNVEYDSNIFNGFFSYTDAAKLISRERAELHIFSHVTYAEREGTDAFYLLHSDVIKETTEVLLDTSDKYSTGVSFEDVGMDLSSDFYRKNFFSREDAKEYQSEMLKEADESGKKIMINMGNDFAMPYADEITNMDLCGSEYTILDECIPFYQLAVHGHVNYTGEALNICGNDEEELLYSAEYGAGLYFVIMRESSFALQKTLYTEYYGADYSAWHDRMVEIYTR